MNVTQISKVVEFFLNYNWNFCLKYKRLKDTKLNDREVSYKGIRDKEKSYKIESNKEANKNCSKNLQGFIYIPTYVKNIMFFSRNSFVLKRYFIEFCYDIGVLNFQSSLCKKRYVCIFFDKVMREMRFCLRDIKKGKFGSMVRNVFFESILEPTLKSGFELSGLALSGLSFDCLTSDYRRILLSKHKHALQTLYGSLSNRSVHFLDHEYNYDLVYESFEVISTAFSLSYNDFCLKIIKKDELLTWNEIFSNQLFFRLLACRICHIPISKVTQKSYFMNGKFFNANCLAPRQDTEILVNEAMKIARLWSNKCEQRYVLELGTGSGCVLISVLNELNGMNDRQYYNEEFYKDDLPKVFGYGVDIVKKSLKTCLRNIEKFGLQKQVSLYLGNWFSIKKCFYDCFYESKNRMSEVRSVNNDSQTEKERLVRWTEGGSIEISRPLTPYKFDLKFDLILCNPPYIGFFEKIQYETQCDSRRDLFAKENGLEHYVYILSSAASYLKSGGCILFEVGAVAVNELPCPGLYFSRYVNDYSGKKRVAVFFKK